LKQHMMILQTMYGELSLASLADPISFGFDSDVDAPLDTPTLIGELTANADGVLNTPVSRESKGNFNFVKPDVEVISRQTVARLVKPDSTSESRQPKQQVHQQPVENRLQVVSSTVSLQRADDSQDECIKMELNDETVDSSSAGLLPLLTAIGSSDNLQTQFNELESADEAELIVSMIFESLNPSVAGQVALLSNPVTSSAWQSIAETEGARYTQGGVRQAVSHPVTAAAPVTVDSRFSAVPTSGVFQQLTTVADSCSGYSSPIDMQFAVTTAYSSTVGNTSYEMKQPPSYSQCMRDQRTSPVSMNNSCWMTNQIPVS
jgi:hypothetical protein